MGRFVRYHTVTISSMGPVDAQVWLKLSHNNGLVTMVNKQRVVNTSALYSGVPGLRPWPGDSYPKVVVVFFSPSR
jgi:hypothetical protein